MRRALDKELKQVIEGLCLRRPALPASAIHRTVQNLCVRNGWRVPSYDVVHEIASQISPDMKVMAHEGLSSYEQTFELLHRHEAERSNDLWQADHACLDILVLDSTGKAVKPWLTAILDDYSRAVAGYYLGAEPPSSMRIALALRQAIWRKSELVWTICGIPDQFYSDRGSDFKSDHIDQISIELKFETLRTLPRKPKGKGKIERFFETVAQLFLTQQPGYAPKGSGVSEPVLKLEELENRFRKWLIEDYLQRVHSETGMSPKSRWESGDFIPRMPDSKEQLDILLLTVAKPRNVHRDGIRFQGFRYFDVNLAGHIGEEVTIRYDPRDLAEILVYSENSLLCRAVCTELSEKTISLKEVIRARNSRRREVRENLIDLLQVADRHVPPEMANKEMAMEQTPKTAEYPKFKIKRFACDDD
jgi:putative transposase